MKKKSVLYLMTCLASFWFATDALSGHEETALSQKLRLKMLRYHRQNDDFDRYNYVWPPSVHTWRFEKSHFTQYLVNLRTMVLKVYELLEFYKDKQILSDREYVTLMEIIESTSLGEAIEGDLRQEHHNYSLYTVTPQAALYLQYLDNLKDQQDPVPLLISVYTVVFGHAFGAQNFLKMGERLNYGQSSFSRAYPKDKGRMWERLGPFIDTVDRRAGKNESAAELGEKIRHAAYLENLLQDFVLQARALEILYDAKPFPPWFKGPLVGPCPFWWMNLFANWKFALFKR